MKIDAAVKNMIEAIELLENEAGLIGILHSICSGEKLRLQCQGKDLRMYIEKNNLEYNYKDNCRLGYETEDYILFEHVSEVTIDEY